MGDDIRINLMTISDSVVIVIEEPSDLGAVREFCLVHLLRNIHGLAWWYIDSRIPLQARASLCQGKPSFEKNHSYGTMK
ncbi:hypothetical protein LP415_24780 [Polaromonas sp. P1(28)-8]|nr:hypothetical protein LP415_24780 [Polaromonas sp. P1(28)-8]